MAVAPCQDHFLFARDFSDYGERHTVNSRGQTSRPAPPYGEQQLVVFAPVERQFLGIEPAPPQFFRDRHGGDFFREHSRANPARFTNVAQVGRKPVGSINHGGG